MENTNWRGLSLYFWRGLCVIFGKNPPFGLNGYCLNQHEPKNPLFCFYWPTELRNKRPKQKTILKPNAQNLNNKSQMLKTILKPDA